MSIADRYSKAIASSDLRVQARVAGDADLLIASGWAGAGSSLASLIHRARSEFDRHPGAVQPEARAALHAFVAKQAVLLGFSLDPDALLRLSDAILDVMLRPTCGTCKGVAFAPIPGTGRLSAIACPACLGTGRRRVHVETTGERELAAEVRQRIETKLDAHARKMGRVLRDTA